MGETAGMKRQTANHVKAHRDKDAERQNKVIAQARADREIMKQEAQMKVVNARANEANLYEEHNRVRHELAESRAQLNNTSFSLAQASSDLAKLGDRELELVRIP
jgi:hypothetical protein